MLGFYGGRGFYLKRMFNKTFVWGLDDVRSFAKHFMSGTKAISRFVLCCVVEKPTLNQAIFTVRSVRIVSKNQHCAGHKVFAVFPIAR